MNAPTLLADGEALGREAAALLHTPDAEIIAPSFADVVRRAAALPDAQISVQDIQLAETMDALTREEIEAGLNFGTLDDFLDDVADFVAEQDVAEPPPLRAAEAVAAENAPASRPAATWARWAAAAAILLALPVAVPSLARAWATWRSETVSLGYASTMDRIQLPTHDGDATERPAKRATKRRVPASAPVESVPEAEPELAPAPTEPTPIVDDEPVAAPRGPTKAERLRALDAEAQAAWKRGELGVAQTKFEALVRAAGGRDVADIAYGDLFEVARQRKDAAAELQYWKRYVRRFPKGRYIDDARAGICRRTAGDRALECWRAYLRDRPNGTYRTHAQRVLDQSQ